MICKRIQVFGKVQGVFYRASTKTKADDLDLKGWVKNEYDGSVLMEVEGEEDAVKEMIAWCKEGPTYARVSNLEEETISLSDFQDFEIRY